MSVDVLLSGTLHGAPQARTSKNGNPFVTCTLRCGTRDGSTVFASVICFSTSACRALMALSDGDSISVSGEASLKVYTPRDGGEPRASVDLLAHVILTPYHVRRRREAVAESKATERAAPEPSACAPAEPDPDDAIAF